MGEFVKKTMIGYKEVADGQYDPECTHVILSLEEYNVLNNRMACAYRDAEEAKRSAQWQIERIEREMRSEAAREREEAEKRVAEAMEELGRANREINYQKGLNENLLRISRERANADRKLRPKKEHTGYVVVSSVERDYRYKSSRGESEVVRLWETVIQTPYSVDMTHEQVKNLTLELMPMKDGKNRLLVRIGISSYCNMTYEEMMEHPTCKNWTDRNVMLKRHLKANFRTGYWEISFQHTKPLGIVPKEMRIC